MSEKKITFPEIVDPLVVPCETTLEANVFEKERGDRYRLSESLSQKFGKYIFLRRERPKEKHKEVPA